MGKYRDLGVNLDRKYRNDLNANFTDVEAEGLAQKARVDNLIVGTPQPSEVVDARGGFTVLRDRLADTESSLADTTTNANVVLGIGVFGEKFPKLTDETNDSPRILRALNSLGTDGGILKLTALSYSTSSPIELPENVFLEGKGHGVNQTKINYTGTGFAIKTKGQHTRTNIKNIRLQTNGTSDGILIGDSYANLGGYVPGIGQMDNVTIHGLGVGKVGLKLFNVSHFSMDNVHIGYGATGGTGLKIESDTLNTGVIVGNNCVFGRVDSTDVGMIIDGNASLDSFSFNGCYFGGNTATVQLGQSPSGVVRNANFNGCHYESRTGSSIEIYNVRAANFIGLSVQGYSTLTNAVIFKAGATIRRVNFFGLEANSVLTNIYNNEGATVLEDCILQAAVKTGSTTPTQFTGDFSNCQRFDETKFRLKSIVPEEIYFGGRKHTYGSAAPTTGTASQGDVIHNSANTRTKNIAFWKCIAGGTPGTWMATGTGYGTKAERDALTLTVGDAGYLYKLTDDTLTLNLWNGTAWI